MKYFILRRDNYVNFGDYASETSTYNRMGIVDWVFEVFGKDILIFTIIAVLYFVMIKVFSLLIYRKTEKLDTYDKIATKLDGPLKYLLSLLFFILVTLGVIQVISYYLLATDSSGLLYLPLDLQ